MNYNYSINPQTLIFIKFHLNFKDTVHQSVFTYTKSFQLESGLTLEGFHLQYTTYGELNTDKSNVVWVFHALTANSEAADWWPGLIGDGKIFNPENHFIICVNVPGSCYGSISPLDRPNNTEKPFFHDFPTFSIRDMVSSFQLLKDFLAINHIWLGIGGSMGGMQLLEWAAMEPSLFEHIIPIGTNAKNSPWSIALNASQRMAIEADQTWKENHPDAGIEGLKVARSIALLSYRDYNAYNITQQGITEESKNETVDKQIFRAETYQKYQGKKLADRFNAYSYYTLTRSMDTHDLGRGRNSIETTLGGIRSKTLVIGIFTDILFPPEEQMFIASHIPNAEVHIINSLFGHDGFLLEFDAIEKMILNFLDKVNQIK